MKSQRKSSQFPWWLKIYAPPAWLAYLAVWLLFLARGLFLIDPDFGWHLAAGNYYWAHGIPEHDIFTFAASNFPWINHEWLSDMILAALHGAGGYWLVAVFYAALWTAAFWLVVRRRLPLAAVFGALVCLPFAGVRAIAWTVFCVAVLHELFRLAPRWRGLIPGLMLIWANLHGGFVVGLAYIGYRWLRQPSWRGAALGMVSILATTATPYGAAIYVEIIRTLNDRSLHGRIDEWRTLAFGIEVAILAAVWVALRYLYTRSAVRTALTFPVILLLASIMSVRNVPLLALFIVADISYMIYKTKIPWQQILGRLRQIRGCMIVLALLAVIFSGYLVWRGLLERASLEPEARYPRAIASTLQAGACRGGNLYNDYNIGGYLIWRAPQQKVYIDGRMPSWQHAGVKYMDNYYRVMNDQAFRQREFARFHIICAAIPKGSPLAKSLRQSGWKTIISDSAGYALLKASE